MADASDGTSIAGSPAKGDPEEIIKGKDRTIQLMKVKMKAFVEQMRKEKAELEKKLAAAASGKR